MMNALRLKRAAEDVGSFLSALGSLRETRLTAALGFLVARFPADFGPLLGLKITPADEISIEETDGGDRYDVLIKNSGEEHIIEGKVGLSQRSEQLLRYIKNRRKPGRPKPALTVVDEGSEFSQSRQQAFQKVRQNVRSLRFVTSKGSVPRIDAFFSRVYELPYLSRSEVLMPTRTSAFQARSFSPCLGVSVRGLLGRL